MTNEVLANYLSDSILSFRNYKKMAERAIEQVSDDGFFEQIDAESNSIGLIVKHIAGNARSRWSDFLTTDGEKPDRNRDTEFQMIGDTRESLIAFWESGWQTVFSALEPLTTDDLGRTVTIRGEAHTVVEAINRQLTHYAYHVGQIVYLAKHLKSAEWKTLSVPRNRSRQFNEFLSEKQRSGEVATDRFDSVSQFAEQEPSK